MVRSYHPIRKINVSLLIGLSKRSGVDRAQVCEGDTHHKQGVSIVQHVLGGDSGPQVGRPIRHKVCSICCGDVLQHNLEVWHSFYDGLEDAVDEDPLSIKEIHCWVGDLAMY